MYSTTDTALATYLITAGHIPHQIDYTQPRFAYFFVDSNNLRELAAQYIAGRAMTEPIAFNRINKKLLRIIREQKQWEED